ncbi:SRPBCC family protein [Ectothiorhodospiraceae bacterium 2226]|nr:SRPBCC family protein [Ectothiorhodospiraceae bacterium 2226]
MPVIEQTVHIEAPPARVFGLISQVEGFADYTDLIERIDPLGDDRYRWCVRVAGMSLKWDVEIVECVPVERFAWRSVSGVPNHGCYRLTPVGEGTKVSLSMEYQLKNRLVEKVVERTATPMIKKVGLQILERVRARLETPAGA